VAERKGAGPGAHPAWGRLVLSIGILGVGLFYVAETMAIRVLPTYARVGPRFFPYLVAAGLVLIGAALAWRAWRGLDSDDDPTDDTPSDKLNMALVVGGLVLQSLIIEYIGFVLAAAITFVLTAAGFGDRHWLRNAAIGLVLAAASYVGFTRGLGLSLPAGMLEGLF
jgi:putative tricarboxylic transport membrane protein